MRSPAQYVADADLTTTSDVDVFLFKAASTTATVTLQAQGLSLLRARVSVYDGSGTLIASGAAADLFHNDVALGLSGLTVNASYFVRVEGATADAFRVGAYRLTADTGTDKAPKPVAQLSVTDAHTNDTLATATDLKKAQKLAPDSRFDLTYRGAIEDAADTDSYRILTPKTAAGAMELNVIVWATDGALNPRIRVFDAAGNAVAFRVLANEAGLMSVVVTDPLPGMGYVVQVSARSAVGTGAYVLGADFNAIAPPPVQEVDSGALDAKTTKATDTLTMSAGGIYQFALYAEPLAPGRAP